MVPWAIVVVMGRWDHHAGRGFRAELLPISQAASLYGLSKSPGVLPRWCWLFLPSLVLLRACLTPCLCDEQDLSKFILSFSRWLFYMCYVHLQLCGKLDPFAENPISMSHVANAKSPLFSPWRWLNLCSIWCERFAGWFIGLMLFLRMFAEGFTVSGHCQEFFLLSFHHLVFSVFGGLVSQSSPAPALFFSL